MANRNRVVIPTLDPRFVGGVRSVTEVAYGAAGAAGFDAEIVYNAIPWEECVTVRDLLRGRWDISVEHRMTDGLDGVGIGRVLPRFEVFNYRLNDDHWQTALTGTDAILAVGGPCLPALPAARAGREFAVWFGTVVEDERNVQKHDYRPPERLRYELTRPILRRYERDILQEADRVFAQSTYTRERAIERHDLRPAEVDVLPCAVDTDRYRPDPDTANADEVVLVGRLNDPRKNLVLLIEAFARVVTQIPDARLTLVGAEPDEAFRDRIRELGIEANVSAPGEVDSVIPYLQRAAVFAYPSHQEGFGIAALEALSCGTPVVTTDCGGPTDFVIDGETGFVVDRGDADAFGDRLLVLLEDESRRRRYGESGRDLATSEFSRKHVAGRLRSILDDLTS